MNTLHPMTAASFDQDGRSKLQRQAMDLSALAENYGYRCGWVSEAGRSIHVDGEGFTLLVGAARVADVFLLRLSAVRFKDQSGRLAAEQALGRLKLGFGRRPEVWLPMKGAA